MPAAEIILWSKLKSNQIDGYKFRRQYGIGMYIVNFYCPATKLAIELDGESHFWEGAKQKDASRQKNIESFGIKFLRFSNTDVYENIQEVMSSIRENLNTTPTPPNLGGD